MDKIIYRNYSNLRKYSKFYLHFIKFYLLYLRTAHIIDCIFIKNLFCLKNQSIRLTKLLTNKNILQFFFNFCMIMNTRDKMKLNRKVFKCRKHIEYLLLSYKFDYLLLFVIPIVN